MRRITAVPALVIAAALATSSPARAQEPHAVERSEIEAALEDHASRDDARREAVLELLRRQKVREVANGAGIDLERATAAVATLEGHELERISSLADRLNRELAGGDPIVISTTTVIIALLVVILILVAAN